MGNLISNSESSSSKEKDKKKKVSFKKDTKISRKESRLITPKVNILGDHEPTAKVTHSWKKNEFSGFNKSSKPTSFKKK